MQLRNTGDLAARFAWYAASLGPYFSVAPASGQVEAGQELALEVAFRPTSTLADLHAQEVKHTGCMTDTTVDASPDLHDVLLARNQSPLLCFRNCAYTVTFSDFSS